MMSQQKKLSIAFYWHMHQPIYQLSDDGDFLMPWVRLHAIKDYIDMVTILDNFEKLKLNINLVPALLSGIIKYGEKDFHDIHSRLTVMDIDKLNDSDKEFILNNFFDANYQTMILPNPEYHRLFKKHQSSPVVDIRSFSPQEYSDLMALFNLAWFDPTYKNSIPELKKLVKKGKNYTTEDRRVIIEIQRNIIRQLIPTYKKYLDANRIELTTSPYYHPILPIMLDSENLSEDLKKRHLNLDMEDDAKLQVKLALDKIEEIFGVRPKGIWPSEHCISPKELDLFKEEGLEWTISYEGILSESIKFDFVRDFRGYLEDPYHLLKTYKYKTKNSNIDIIFRDSVIPNLISFEYFNHDSVAAANDLYDRIKVTQSKILSSPDENHLLTIAMDGENCWENYKDDGGIFLNTLYKLIENDDSLETVLLSDYIGKKDKPKPLAKVASGSWINRNFKLWTDEPLKDSAWTYLKSVHDDFTKYVKKHPDNPNIELARREIFVAEGSDWFWWYGEPNDSGRDNIFDYIFREHLKNMYIYLGLKYPSYLDMPLLSVVSKPSRYPKGEITPDMTGEDNNDASWLNSGCIDIPDGPVLKEDKFFDKICFGYDKENLYLRLYVKQYTKEHPLFKKMVNQMYIYTRTKNKKHPLSPIRVIHKSEGILPISKEKFHNEIELSIYEGQLNYVRIVEAMPDNLWVINSAKGITALFDNVVDVKIPFDKLDVDHGETVEFLFINANFGIKDFYIPNEMLLTLKRD